MTTTPTKSDEWETIQEAAIRRKVHTNTIRNAISRGDLDAVRLGSRIIRVRATDVDALFTPYEAGEFGVWAQAGIR